ncbi:hypothetical protein GGI43DRAFT_428559 [Trichoderma evansii]
MASIADRIKDRTLRRINTGRISRSGSIQKQQSHINRRNPRKSAINDDEGDDEDDDGSEDDSPKDGSKPSAKKPNPGSGHRCKPPQINNVWRKYGVDDPTDYQPPTCDQCLNTKMANQCNVDSILGYGCTLTKACREGKCTVNGQEMEARPNPRVDVARWIRSECHICQNKTKKGTVTAGCSWLRDRATWDQACSYCESHNLTCLSGGRVIANPQTLTLPKSWAVNLQVFDRGFIECRKINPDRRYCKRCHEDEHDHCRADASSYFYSCNRCTQLGVDCIDAEDDTSYPLFDLARVGIGGFLPFVECECCRKAGRNCDLQRPCDSCVKHGDGCDDWRGDTAKYCIKGRLDPPPGPLYYLALGYGAGGVDDPKDGSAIEHWVGPATNIYSIPENQNRNFIATMGVQLRSMLRAPGAPPHGDATQGGSISGRASEITREQIVAWIKDRWPQAVPMNQLGHYRERIEAVQQKMQDIREGKIVSALFSDFHDHGSDNEEDDDGVNDEGNGNNTNSLCIRPKSTDNSERNRVVNAHSDNGDAAATNPAHLIFDTSAPDWLTKYINADMIDDGVVSPPFECLSLPGQSRFDFDAAAPSSQAAANIQFSPFEVSNVDPSLYLMDLDQDFDTSVHIDSQASLGMEDAEFIDHNSLRVAQEALLVPPREPTIPTLYNFNLGQQIRADCPFYNIFGLIPEDVKPLEDGIDWSCSELGCWNLVTPDYICQCPAHGDDRTPVCDECCDQSNQELSTNLVTEAQLLGMRAYLCTDCAAQVSRSVNEVSRRRTVGAVNIWGDCSNSHYTKTELELMTGFGRINFRGEAKPMTGCCCGTKLFAQRLCHNHRSLYANLLVEQVARIREWCIERFGRYVCPACLVDKPADEANSAMDLAELSSEANPKAWVCLVCGDWVVNQKLPVLVPG